MPNESALLWTRVGLQAYPPQGHQLTTLRAYGFTCFFTQQGENTCTTEGVCFRRRIFAMLLMKFSVKAALWRSLATPARISGHQGTGGCGRAPAERPAGPSPSKPSHGRGLRPSVPHQQVTAEPQQAGVPHQPPGSGGLSSSIS